MDELVKILKSKSSPGAEPGIPVVRPLFFRISETTGQEALAALLKEKPFIQVHDMLGDQLVELVKTGEPARKFDQSALKQAIAAKLEGRPEEAYGVWVYYPWNERLVHILDRHEFTELRTNRNMYKITAEEKNLLASRKIGVVGLSVGQSVAVTLAMESAFGELRIADFDTLGLSNLNRIRSAVHNLGLPKTVIVAREIAEIDPFLRVTCYHKGLTKDNIEDFFLKDGKLDLVIDECDGLDMKILCRDKARQLRVPVVMDTSDRGMIDIERFDLEPDRPILHGLIQGIDPLELAGLSNEDKVPYVLQIIGAQKLSLRSKASMFEVGQSITTWPQLASSVVMGGAIVADIVRRIFTGKLHVSGRFYVDPEQIIRDEKQPPEAASLRRVYEMPAPLSVEQMEGAASALHLSFHENQVDPGADAVTSLVSAASAAPSLGNNQPWKWLYKKGFLLLFHDLSRTLSFGDFNNMASFITFGAAIENLVLKAHETGLEVEAQLFPDKKMPSLVSLFRFYRAGAKAGKLQSHAFDDLSPFIFKRHTNRRSGPRRPVNPGQLDALSALAANDGGRLQFITEDSGLKRIGDLIAAGDRLRFLHPQGHHDFFNEMRWDPAENERTRDGLDIATVDLKLSEIAAFQLARDWNTIQLLDDWDLGDAFGKLSRKAVDTASAIGLLTVPSYSPESFIHGGRLVERIWLKATAFDLAFQPLESLPLFFSRLIQGKGVEMPPKMQNVLRKLRPEFLDLFDSDDDKGEVFLFRLFIAPKPAVLSLRKPIEEILYIGK
jgi:molybdopterin/thiamine biosynthesis adenylyltransferase